MSYVLVLVVIFFSFSSQALIFGTDDRQEAMSSPVAAPLLPSVGLMISETHLQINKDQTYNLDFLPISDSTTQALCKEEKFSNQYVAYINCTGFLVADDLMVTAGHCMNYKGGIMQNEQTGLCQYFQWVFDYHTDKNGIAPLQNYSADQVYKCKEVVYGELFSGTRVRRDQSSKDIPDGGEFGTDFAIIRLDRKVSGRKPMTIAPANKPVRKAQPLFTIGYPSSLPAKYAKGKLLQDKYQNYFITNLDIAGGNSGSPVFNAQSEVVGIAVRVFPTDDYIYDPVKGCARNFVCNKIGAGDCNYPGAESVMMGTHVQRIDIVRDVLKQINL